MGECFLPAQSVNMRSPNIDHPLLRHGLKRPLRVVSCSSARQKLRLPPRRLVSTQLSLAYSAAWVVVSHRLMLLWVSTTVIGRHRRASCLGGQSANSRWTVSPLCCSAAFTGGYHECLSLCNVKQHGLTSLHSGFTTSMKTAEITRHKQAAAGIKPPSTWALFAEIFRKEGLRGVNKGVNAVAVRQCTNWGSRCVLNRLLGVLHTPMLLSFL